MNRLGVFLVWLIIAGPAFGFSPPDKPKGSGSTSVRTNGPIRLEQPSEEAVASRPADSASPLPAGLFTPSPDDFKGLRSVALIGLVSLAPAALLMFTSFVRINIVLVLIRQALGSPQVPGNQVLAALALLLTLLVMKPVADSVYTHAIQPYQAQKITAAQSWEAGSKPIKKFMLDQIRRTNHVHYLWDLYDFAEPPRPGRVEPVYEDEFPLRVRILESTRRAKGPEHVDTYRSMVDLAQTQRNLGNHELALALFTEALDGLDRNGLDQRTLLYQKWAIASELVALKRPKEASRMFDEVVAGAVEHLSPDDPLRKSALRQRRAYRILGTFSRERKPRAKDRPDTLR